MLICKFASESSSPARIDSYIAHLREASRKHQQDSKVKSVVEELLTEAQSWLGDNMDPDRRPRTSA